MARISCNTRDFRDVEGLTLPHSRTKSFDGNTSTTPEIRFEKYVVNGVIDDPHFEEALKLSLKAISK